MKSPIAVLLFYALGGGACIYFIRNLRFNKKILLLAMLTSLTCLGTKSYTSFNMIKRLAADRIAQDTLFHSSIAAMLKNYGVTSTGLHGLVEIQYHVFSHWLYAGVSRLSGVSVFEVYGIIPFLFFIPLLLFS